MSKRNYLKHLGFTTAAAMVTANQTKKRHDLIGV